MLVKAYEAQNSDKPEEAFDYLTKAGEIICYLGEAADEQQNTKHALKEYIDVLSKAQLEQFEHDFPLLQQPRVLLFDHFFLLSRMQNGTKNHKIVSIRIGRYTKTDSRAKAA